MCPHTLVDRKRKRYVNVVDVVERLRDPTDPRVQKSCHQSGKAFIVGNVEISKNFLRTRKIMVMHSNERGECVHIPS